MTQKTVKTCIKNIKGTELQTGSTDDFKHKNQLLEFDSYNFIVELEQENKPAVCVIEVYDLTNCVQRKQNIIIIGDTYSTDKNTVGKDNISFDDLPRNIQREIHFECVNRLLQK